MLSFSKTPVVGGTETGHLLNFQPGIEGTLLEYPFYAH